MELPENITGYNATRLSFSDFQQFCFNLQGLGILNVLELFDCEYPQNYYSAMVSDGDGEFYILQNCFVPLSACALKDGEGFIFFDKPRIESAASHLCEVRQFLSRSELTTDIRPDHLKQLGNYEQKEVSFWLPDNFGGIIFSWYFD